MALDLTALLTSRDDDLPSGMNFEYHPTFGELQRVGAVTPERQEGSKINPAIDPEWGEVKSVALEMLAETHDLRAAGYLAQAALHTDGFAGFAEVLRYMRETLEGYWDTVWPQLDADDDNDPTERINALQVLVDNDTVLRYLRAAPLSESRGFGHFGLRELQYSTGETTAPSGVDVPEATTISAAFQDSKPEVLSAKLAAVVQSLEHVRAIDRAFSANVPHQGPNFEKLVRLLGQIQKALAPHVAAPEEEFVPQEDPGTQEQDDGGAATPAPGRTGAAPSGQISSSRDVTVMLDRILAYYERYEPSSPVPLILHRAKRLVGADFMTIMRDLAPQGVSDVTMISGSEGD